MSLGDTSAVNTIVFRNFAILQRHKITPLVFFVFHEGIVHHPLIEHRTLFYIFVKLGRTSKTAFGPFHL